MSFVAGRTSAFTEKLRNTILDAPWVKNLLANYGAGVELAFQCHAITGTSEQRYSVGIRDNKNPADPTRPDIWYNLMSFTIGGYPACCGLTLFHSFGYHIADSAPKYLHEAMHDILENAVREMMGRNKHIELVMVNKQSARVTSNTQAVPEDHIRHGVQFSFFLEHFQERAKVVDIDKGFWNLNSGNLLHRVDVYY